MNTRMIQVGLLIGGGLCALSTILTPQNPPLILLLSALSAICFIGLIVLVFIRPRSDWIFTLGSGIGIFFTYGVCMPYWGRIWYREGEAEDWKIFILFSIVIISLIAPFIRLFFPSECGPRAK